MVGLGALVRCARGVTDDVGSVVVAAEVGRPGVLGSVEVGRPRVRRGGALGVRADRVPADGVRVDVPELVAPLGDVGVVGVVGGVGAVADVGVAPGVGVVVDFEGVGDVVAVGAAVDVGAVVEVGDGVGVPCGPGEGDVGEPGFEWCLGAGAWKRSWAGCCSRAGSAPATAATASAVIATSTAAAATPTREVSRVVAASRRAGRGDVISVGARSVAATNARRASFSRLSSLGVAGPPAASMRAARRSAPDARRPSSFSARRRVIRAGSRIMTCQRFAGPRCHGARIWFSWPVRFDPTGQGL